MERLASACASAFWTASISTILCGKLLAGLCGPRHRARWLPPILAGARIGCFAATERGAGCDPGSYEARARRTVDGWRLSGVKTKISNATTADVAVVLARRDDPERPGLCYAVVDLHKPGVSRREAAKIGLRAMSWGTLEFDDVALDEGDVIVDASVDRTLEVVEWGQLMQAVSALGLAEAALDRARAHALERRAFGRPLAHMQIVHARLADMQVGLDAARLLTREAARRRAEGQSVREEVMMAKVYATEMAVRTADRALRILGGAGFCTDSDVERLYRDSLANVPAGLPTDRLRELLGCAALSIDPWSYPPFDWLTPAGLRID